jgi:hypothetical protein
MQMTKWRLYKRSALKCFKDRSIKFLNFTGGKTMTQSTDNGQWIILEAMGHQVVGGRYIFENGLHRVDIPDTSPDAPPDRFTRSEYYGAPAIFRITPVTEEAARLVAKSNIIPEAIPWDVRRELRQLLIAEINEAIATEVKEAEEDNELEDEVLF